MQRAIIIACHVHMRILRAKAMKKRKEDDKSNIVFVGGLRKSTTEDGSGRETTKHAVRTVPAYSHVDSKDKVAGHFSKFGQVDSAVASLLPSLVQAKRSCLPRACDIHSAMHQVDIKRLPDGTSRGFAFVKFVEARVTIQRIRGFQVNNCLLRRLNPSQRSWRPRVVTCHLDAASNASFTHSISRSVAELCVCVCARAGLCRWVESACLLGRGLTTSGWQSSRTVELHSRKIRTEKEPRRGHVASGFLDSYFSPCHIIYHSTSYQIASPLLVSPCLAIIPTTYMLHYHTHTHAHKNIPRAPIYQYGCKLEYENVDPLWCLERSCCKKACTRPRTPLS